MGPNSPDENRRRGAEEDPSLRKGAMRFRFKTTIQRETRRDKVDGRSKF